VVTNTPGHGALYVHNSIIETIAPHSGITHVDSVCETIEPHSGIVDFENIDIGRSETVSLAKTQAFLNEFLKECQEGVGGFDSGCIGGVGFGGMLGRFDVGGDRDESSGGASGERGGKGKEYKDQDVGKGRRIEEDDRHGGSGLIGGKGRNEGHCWEWIRWCLRVGGEDHVGKLQDERS
jgi:hypothetical protein